MKLKTEGKDEPENQLEKCVEEMLFVVVSAWQGLDWETIMIRPGQEKPLNLTLEGFKLARFPSFNPVFAKGQSVQSIASPGRPSPENELGKVGLQSNRPYW